MILDNKRVLVTGGTGSLGKATLILAEKENWNTEFVIFSRDETKQSYLKQRFPDYQYILGDVAKKQDVHRAMRGIDIVLHFAAYKQVPSAQNNIPATIETNVIGSQNVVDTAIDAGVERVVASSTDKACECINAYGSSKHLMECIFQDANKWNATTFHLARYGNVVCSNSSVVPLFEVQKARGGPITITDRTMSRFWLSLEQAVQLVLTALDQEPGVIVVPKAPSMYMQDLATCFADGKVEVRETGIRPGEKIHEAMVSGAESFHTIADKKHFYIYPPNSPQVHTRNPFKYTSDNPERWLTWEEMLEMIEIARELGS